MHHPDTDHAGRDAPVQVADDRQAAGKGPDLPGYLRKTMSESIQADMADPARAGTLPWLGDRDRVRATR